MPAELLLVNPRRKRRAKAKSSRRVRARNPRAKRRHRAVSVVTRRIRARNPRRVHAKRRRHRNPRLSANGILHALVPAAIGGAGAVALDIGLGYLPASVPDFLKKGIGNTALKVGGALALGLIAGKVMGREKGKAVAAGALTVVAYGFIRNMVKEAAPTLPGLSGYVGSDYALNPAPMVAGMGAYMDQGAQFQQAQMGAYMQDDGL